MDGADDRSLEPDHAAVAAAADGARQRLEQAKASGLALDLTRGKPSPEQLDLAQPLLDRLGAVTRSANGMDCRNYGILEGLPEARTLFAEFLRVEPDEVYVQDNSSLRLMHDLLAWSLLVGTSEGGPWALEGTTTFLCPTPGYDRHFHLCAHLGVRTEAVPIGADGPDLDRIAERIRDPSVRGMFCVPRFSNPTGSIYSSEVVQALASMETACPDFRIFWDDAYARHELVDGAPLAGSLLDACKQAGCPERVYVFGSTSKVTIAGAGVSMVALAGKNQSWLQANLSKQTIGPNKLIQAAHVEFLEDIAGVDRLMARHASLLRPRFAAALEVLEERLKPLSIATWTRPQGGYFVSLDTLPGCAEVVVDLAAKAGVKLTPAGATFPYGEDPLGRNIRLAPSFPSVEDVRRSAQVLADAIMVASADALGVSS